jgi:hypothetical protein
MSFKILEEKIAGKHFDRKKCEDRIVVSEDFVCVIDGATSNSTKLYNGRKSGLMAGILIENELKTMPRTATISEFTIRLTSSIKKYYVKNNLYEQMKKNPDDRFSASIIVYSDYLNEVWMIGDCQCIIGSTVYTNNKIVDEIISNARSLFIETELTKGKTVSDLMDKDSGREFIHPLLIRQSSFQNRKRESEYNYCVLDGFKVNEDELKVIKADDKTIILASDGYPRLFDTLAESEKYLNYILKNDPLCIRLYKSAKGLTPKSNSFDDRAYIKIERCVQ